MSENKACVNNFKFMAISSQTGLNNGIDGILGMGPNPEAGPSYILAMKE